MVYFKDGLWITAHGRTRGVPASPARRTPKVTFRPLRHPDIVRIPIYNPHIPLHKSNLRARAMHPSTGTDTAHPSERCIRSKTAVRVLVQFEGRAHKAETPPPSARGTLSSFVRGSAIMLVVRGTHPTKNTRPKSHFYSRPRIADGKEFVSLMLTLLRRRCLH
jgi:hypothetical protein